MPSTDTVTKEEHVAATASKPLPKPLPKPSVTAKPELRPAVKPTKPVKKKEIKLVLCLHVHLLTTVYTKCCDVQYYTVHIDYKHIYIRTVNIDTHYICTVCVYIFNICCFLHTL